MTKYCFEDDDPLIDINKDNVLNYNQNIDDTISTPTTFSFNYQNAEMLGAHHKMSSSFSTFESTFAMLDVRAVLQATTVDNHLSSLWVPSTSITEVLSVVQTTLSREYGTGDIFFSSTEMITSPEHKRNCELMWTIIGVVSMLSAIMLVLCWPFLNSYDVQRTLEGRKSKHDQFEKESSKNFLFFYFLF